MSESGKLGGDSEEWSNISEHNASHNFLNEEGNEIVIIQMY